MWSTRHQISGFGFGAFNLKESAFLYSPLLSETPLVWKRGSVINSASHKSSTGRPISPKFNIWVCPEELSCTWLLWSLLACECQCWCYRHGKALLRDAVLVLLMLQQGTECFQVLRSLHLQPDRQQSHWLTEIERGLSPCYPLSHLLLPSPSLFQSCPSISTGSGTCQALPKLL